jgi:hypothetical protein
MAEAITWETTSHTIAAVPAIAVAEELDHGETEDNPTPVPNASRISDVAATTKAPPITAAHDTAEEDASPVSKLSAYPGA